MQQAIEKMIGWRNERWMLLVIFMVSGNFQQRQIFMATVVEENGHFCNRYSLLATHHT